ADDDTTELAAVVVTGVLPSHAMTWETDPHLPRQPVPASDGADYLRTIPGFSTVRNGGTNGDPVLRGMFGSRLNLIAGDGATH
ncbi:TonB-dependent copper receptor, partial [Acinetobacter baumannii]